MTYTTTPTQYTYNSNTWSLCYEPGEPTPLPTSTPTPMPTAPIGVWTLTSAPLPALWESITSDNTGMYLAAIRHSGVYVTTSG